MSELETGTDVTDQNIIEAMQREIEKLESQLEGLRATRDHLQQDVKNLQKQLEAAIGEGDDG